MATLNQEPTLPAERKQQQLSPKSYVDAAEENVDTFSHNGRPPPELYSGQGEDAAPRSPRRNLHKKSGSLRTNGVSKEKKDGQVVVERYEDKDGEHLVSIKQAWDGRKGKAMGPRRNSELVSGRKAGARWEQSQYGDVQTWHRNYQLIIFTVSISLPSQFLSKDACKLSLYLVTPSALPCSSAPSSSSAPSHYSGLSSFPTSYISCFPALDTPVLSLTAPISFALFQSGRFLLPTSLLASIAPPLSPQHANISLAITRTASSRMGLLRPSRQKPSDFPSFSQELQIPSSPSTLTFGFLCTYTRSPWFLF